MSKKRLDVLLVERNLVDTREKAKRVIMAGLVFSENNRLDKPGMKYDTSIPLIVKGSVLPYVGRGGLKLEKALKCFSINVEDKIMIDVGSSTGGFIDCALQNGVKHCYAIDVGYNQLDWKLRKDKRVTVMERTNFRYVTKDKLKKETPNFATVDVSFISLKLILPVLNTLLAPNSEIVILIKPQFEAGREQVGKKGIIREKSIHEEVLSNIITFAIENDYQFYDITYSPITGGEGNIEFLAYLGWENDNMGKAITEHEIRKIVDEAHHALKQK